MGVTRPLFSSSGQKSRINNGDPVLTGHVTHILSLADELAGNSPFFSGAPFCQHIGYSQGLPCSEPDRASYPVPFIAAGHSALQGLSRMVKYHRVEQASTHPVTERSLSESQTATKRYP